MPPPASPWSRPPRRWSCRRPRCAPTSRARSRSWARRTASTPWRWRSPAAWWCRRRPPRRSPPGSITARDRRLIEHTFAILRAMRWQRDDPQLELFGPEQRNLPTVEYMAVNARRIINTLPPSSRMPFRHTINAYRGCRHACTYCFARPTHEYLGLNSGEDFERRIVVKVNAVERLERELDDPAWEGESIAMGTNTDPYQPAEGHYRLTRGLVQVLTRHRNPFSILTKSSMILRDLDVLTEAARRTTVGIAMSIGTDEDDIARLTEPGAAPPSKRLEAISRLADAGLRPTV